jgi:thiosulfate dehydrogenase [quinone] large subunit
MTTATSSAAPVEAVRVQDSIVTTAHARVWLAVLRLATGFIFLWAFLDKTFGLNYSTPPDRAWINGGTPSQGFLTSDAVIGPFKDFFADIASPVTDWLFMLGMLGVGLAVVLGMGIRVAAVAGTIIMAMMWVAEWPPTQGSSNPLIDYHVIYALSLIVIAVTLAGDTWGVGRWWGRVVRHAAWLR